MFQPFYTSKAKGLGLGLSMSRSIIEGFGGFLDAIHADTGGLSLICRFPANLSFNNSRGGSRMTAADNNTERSPDVRQHSCRSQHRVRGRRRCRYARVHPMAA